MSSANSSLRPAWRNQSGGRGFQPPPSVASEQPAQRGVRSQSVGSTTENIEINRSSTYNKFSALDDEDEGIEASGDSRQQQQQQPAVSHHHNNSNNQSSHLHNLQRGVSGGGNSRSEALRQGLGSRGNGSRPGGRSLADLAAQSPGRFGPAAARSTSVGVPPAAAAPDESKIVRFTRERLLSMRPAPTNTLPEFLREFEGNGILSEEAQDPVCWDTFNAEEIWATVPARRTVKTVPGGRSLSEMAEGTAVVGVPPRGRRDNVSSSGRWQRGVALPPPSASDGNNKTRKDRDGANYDNPNDLWDDPVSGAAAGDFSAFGDSKDEVEEVQNLVAFDFEKMTQASQQLEEELHGASTRSRASSDAASVGKDDGSQYSGIENNSNGGTTIPAVPAVVSKTVDAQRPLASTGTTIRSGSGDHVNVFEDFDEPMSSDSTPTAVDPLAAVASNDEEKPQESETEVDSGLGKEDPSPQALPPNNNNNVIPGVTEDVDATSRLMAMIGVSNVPTKPEPLPHVDDIPTVVSAPEPAPVEPVVNVDRERSLPISSPWGLVQPEIAKPVDGLTIPLNPWGGGTLLPPTTASDVIRHSVPSLLQPESTVLNEPVLKGLDLQARLREVEMEQKARQQEELARLQQRRRQEELEAQKRAAALQQQQQAAVAQRQRQQQAGVQSQVELVLMERISIILENSWGRSDLMSILATLHAEDTRVIPLLNSIEALRALIARNPTRVALRHDPAFGAEMAVLLVTNAQWQQQQQRQQQQEALNRARREEELRRLEQQRLMEEEQEALRRLQEQQQLQLQQQQESKPIIVPDAPWFYSDPQQNIQGPFRGEEMRQWYDAGYFKGDLPVSQSAGGPFRLLSDLYPNLDLAFMNPESQLQRPNNQHRQHDEEAMANEELRVRVQQQCIDRETSDIARFREAEERERLAQEAAVAREMKAREEEVLEREREAALLEYEEQQSPHHLPPEDSHDQSDSGNESSAQLKMMLGLSAQQDQYGGDHNQREQPSMPKRTQSKVKKATSAGAKIAQQLPPAPTQEWSSQQYPSPNASKPAASAWGVSSKQKSSQPKSMSEIQQEEARLVALQAMQRERSGFSGGSSGWANVAASKTATVVGPATSWTGSAATKIAPAVVVANKEPVMMMSSTIAKPTQVLRKQTSLASATSRGQVANVAAVNAASSSSKQPNHNSKASTASTSSDEFGAKMSPVLERWCKEQMLKLNGTDDLTLVSFCMTLNDPNEIRQYLVTYLGSSPQVNNFANEFIHRKLGVKPAKAEEWETTVSTKKKGKKKPAAAGGR